MDRVRKGLLLGLGLVIGAALLWIALTLHRDAVKRMETQLMQYEEQMTKLDEIGGDIEELSLLRDRWQSELDSLEQIEQTETFEDIYDFSSTLLNLLELATIEVEKYRFMEDDGRQFLEVQYRSSSPSLFRFLRTVSDEHPTWYVKDLSVHRGRDSVTGIMRIGYE